MLRLAAGQQKTGLSQTVPVGATVLRAPWEGGMEREDPRTLSPGPCPQGAFWVCLKACTPLGEGKVCRAALADLESEATARI